MMPWSSGMFDRQIRAMILEGSYDSMKLIVRSAQIGVYFDNGE